jgi:hypothetical protein
MRTKNLNKEFDIMTTTTTKLTGDKIKVKCGDMTDSENAGNQPNLYVKEEIYLADLEHTRN